MSVAAQPPPARALKALRAYHSGANEDVLIEKHLPLVKTTVDRMRIYLPTALEIDDLYSVGFTGLAAAARRFDPGQGVPFAAFATLHIRGAVHDELRRMDWMPRTIREKAKKFSESNAALEQRLGRAPTEDEMRKELSLGRDDYDALLDEIKPTSFLPLDGEAYSEDSDNVALHDIIADDSQTTGRDELQKKELIHLVIGRLQQLPDMQKKVLAMYYFEEMRLAEIAAVFGVTEGRISQIHTQAMIGLRSFVKRAEAA
jgi:RNA polymerase sigma factor for flagellar operon FliA